ncbi:MAG TPA: hypothetical protein VN420_00125 [Candidatus Fimivivens sp.]|nr:hypothetical protein [Candidatus Fimivivens sp.]
MIEASGQVRGTGASDEYWFDRFKTIGIFQAYEYFNDDPASFERQRHAFFSDSSRNPEFGYPLLSDDLIEVNERSLLALRDELLEKEKDVVIRNAYLWRIEEKIAEAGLLRAAAHGDMLNFRECSESVYGAPNVEIFSHTIHEIRDRFESARLTAGETLRGHIDDFLSAFPESEAHVDVSLPDEALRAEVFQKIRREFGRIADMTTSETEKVGSDGIKTAFGKALEKLGITDWTISLETTGNPLIRTDQVRKSIIIPADRIVTVSELSRLLIHEIATHAERRSNGERTRFLLLSLGLDHYEVGEEGIAAVREQAFKTDTDTFSFSGLEGYFSIGLAYGVSDGIRRDFRDVFSVMKRYYRIINLSKGMSPTDAEQHANESAWTRCFLTFRGTDCKTMGVCFTKDIIYRKGNIAIWDSLREQSGSMDLWNVGKYDPSNDRHRWLLERLRISRLP